MKVIKRDGRAVDYNREKIEIAIEKANKEVKPDKRATKEEIKEITRYIEDIDRKRILVEDIQDIIEEQLMDRKKFELAKKYMIYRYKRALVRKQNTTDESILGVIKNKNKELQNESFTKNPILVSTQRDYIAGEVSKDLTKRILLPEKITKAHEEGIIHFHNMEYFLQPIINCSLINISDMLENGTVINGKLIETPKSFQVAVIVMTQIIEEVSSNQYGELALDISHLGKYAKMSYNKYKEEIINDFGKVEVSEEKIEELANKKLKREIEAGVQTINYQINTLTTANGECPPVTLFLNINKDDEYIKENLMIIEEIIKQKYEGMKNEKGEDITPEYPKLIYVLDEHNSLNGGEYDYLTKLAIKCTEKRLSPSYISAKKMRENYEGNVFCPCGSNNFLSTWKDKDGKYKYEGRFNQGIVTINLPQIAIISDGDEEKFFELLKERLELSKEALMCKYYALQGTSLNTSPIHWKYGAISRIKSDDIIDELLKDGYSTLSLGYIGIYEATKLTKGVSHISQDGYKFAIKIMKLLKETVERWKKETGLGFTLYMSQEDKVGYRFVQIDRDEFGEIKDITDKDCYTKGYQTDLKEDVEIFEKLNIESEFQRLSLGGGISYIDMSKLNNQTQVEEMIKFIYNNVQYAEFK